MYFHGSCAELTGGAGKLNMIEAFICLGGTSLDLDIDPRSDLIANGKQ